MLGARWCPWCQPRFWLCIKKRDFYGITLQEPQRGSISHCPSSVVIPRGITRSFSIKKHFKNILKHSCHLPPRVLKGTKCFCLWRWSGWTNPGMKIWPWGSHAQFLGLPPTFLFCLSTLIVDLSNSVFISLSLGFSADILASLTDFFE